MARRHRDERGAYFSRLPERLFADVRKQAQASASRASTAGAQPATRDNPVVGDQDSDTL